MRLTLRRDSLACLGDPGPRSASLRIRACPVHEIDRVSRLGIWFLHQRFQTTPPMPKNSAVYTWRRASIAPPSPWRLQEHTRYVTPRHTRRHPRVQPPSSRPSASWRDRVSSRRAGRVSRPSGALRGCPACPILCVQRSPAAHQAAGHVDQGGARSATHTPARLHSHDDHWRRPRRPQPR